MKLSEVHFMLLESLTQKPPMLALLGIPHMANVMHTSDAEILPSTQPCHAAGCSLSPQLDSTFLYFLYTEISLLIPKPHPCPKLRLVSIYWTNMQFNKPEYFLVHLLTHADISQQKSVTAFIHGD